MNSEQVLKARELLQMMAQENTQIVVQLYSNGYRTDYEDTPSTVIEWLNTKGLIICTEVLGSENLNFAVEVYKCTELGSLVEMFSILSNEWELVDIEGLDAFIACGKSIQNILQKYNDMEVEPLSKLLTGQEQDAYNQYYRQSIQEILKNRTQELPNVDPTLTDETILPMFQLSVELGELGANETRMEEYVLRKINEELGEMTLEMNIRDGLSYKEAGSDGVAGEAVDLAICAMDMFALQYPGKTAEEIHSLFVEYMIKKLDKWKQTIGL